MDDQRLLALLAAAPMPLSQLARALAVPPGQLAGQLQALVQAGVALQQQGDCWQLRQPPDLHQRDRIEQLLAPATLPLLGGLEVLWEVDSTNSELLRRPLPQAGVSVLLAERQTAGRGRRGRHWVSPLAQHVYLSLACRFQGGIAAMAGLSLAVGVLVAEALRDHGLTGVGLKWPNDLLLGGRKLGGILLESRGSAQGPALAVIGIGLNVHNAAAAAGAIDQPWTSIDQHLPGLAQRDGVVAAVLNGLIPGLVEFEREGLAPFLTRYAALDVLAGQPVWIHQDGQRQPATALGLAADGGLRVLDQHGQRCLHAGDVSVRKQ